MQPSEPRRFGSSQPNIAKSSGTGENKTRKQPDPATAEINKARKVWDAEGSGQTGDRVADASDAGGQTVPYSVETQADAIGSQTKKSKR